MRVPLFGRVTHNLPKSVIAASMHLLLLVAPPMTLFRAHLREHLTPMVHAGGQPKLGLY